jgi:hypothetical protein
MKKIASSPEYKKIRADITKKYWKENRAEIMDKIKKATKKISHAQKKRFQNPEERAKIGKAVKEYIQNHPNLKNIFVSRMKIYYLNNRRARKRLFENTKNPFNPHIKTKQGFIVRSKGEKIIADALFELNIKSYYESIILFFSETSTIPDFYLPKENKIIEFYGGYPQAWKKKVEKNKIYKKYHVPVIFITPAELKEIKNVLLSEFRKGKTDFNFKKFERNKSPIR